jgi:hypothetical protein
MITLKTLWFDGMGGKQNKRCQGKGGKGKNPNVLG